MAGDIWGFQRIVTTPTLSRIGAATTRFDGSKIHANRNRIAPADGIVIFRREVRNFVEGGDRRLYVREILDAGLNIG